MKCVEHFNGDVLLIYAIYISIQKKIFIHAHFIIALQNCKIYDKVDISVYKGYHQVIS